MYGLVAFLFLPAADPGRGSSRVLRTRRYTISLLQEVPSSKRTLFGSEFQDLVRVFADRKSVVLQGLNPDTAARQLDNQKWHLGVFQGVEFAWVQDRYPKLKPLMIATPRIVPVRAVLLVGKDSGITGWADLKGKDVSMLGSRLGCRLWTDKATGKKSAEFFGKIQRTRNVEEAFDTLWGGKVQGAIVDTEAIAFYKDLQPGRFAQLKMVTESEPFPPAVIVYREGTPLPP